MTMRDLADVEANALIGPREDDEEDDDDSNVGASSSSGTTTNMSSTNNTPKDGTQTSESSTLARAETNAVNRSKMAVLFVLTLAAVSVSVATFLFTRNSETKEFQGKFHDFAIEMEELIHDEARNVFRTVESFATIITSESLATQAQWPFVSVPHFEVRGIELNQLANSLMIGFSPLVPGHLKEAYELYASTMQGWIQEGIDYNIDLHKDYMWQVEHLEPIFPHIYKRLDSAKDDPDPARIPVTGDGPFLPVWQLAPAPHNDRVINYDLLNHEVFHRVFDGMNHTLTHVLSEATPLDFLYGGSVRDDIDHPHSFMLQPIFEDFNETHRDHSHIKGAVIAVLPWDHYFENILPPEAHGIHVLLESDGCNSQMTYLVNGPEAIFLGYGDLHDRSYTFLEESTEFAPFEKLNVSDNMEHCEYDLHIYPSWDLEKDYRTTHPVLYAFLVFIVFFATTMVFILYDFYVTTRQNKVMLAAKRSNAVVASLFPKNVRERMLQEAEDQILAQEKSGIKGALRLGSVPKNQLKNFLDDGIAKADGVAFDTKPIADLFPNTTIMFADISGFTAWSSVREPTQVFTLLETVYHAFDEIAKRRRVFKVETIGDCYVAVAGLPEPRKDHASVMARFARDCLSAMNDLTKKLEVSLGPDTGELAMRVGLHSGPVTAGVLRGDKSRFQLFGDTVNTASRMESTGTRNRIQVSKETADLLKATGKAHWFIPRKDKVQAKGKGYLDTYWLDMKKQSSHSERSGQSKASSESNGSVHLDMPHLHSLSNKAGAEMAIDATIPAKIKRRVQWNVDVLLRLLKQVVARRNAVQKIEMEDGTFKDDPPKEEMRKLANGKTVLDEVQEIIELPNYNAKAAREEEDPGKIELPTEVVKQLQEFVTIIASLYHHDNPFHNFEHASHVTMSVTKLLSRIVTPEEILSTDDDDDAKMQHIHDHTYGITSDPLTQFAVAFSALIHDVDHLGVPNAQLIKEHASIAAVYNNQSVAEQNSVDLSWNLLMDDSFKELRSFIYATEAEQKRFRQLVVNVVLATDICDKQLKDLRNNRWDKAFRGEDSQTEEDAMVAVNRKATIVLEHLIQASDVAHTMQHWHIYRKWNEAFFLENMQAFKQGRSEKDPTEYWYKGEMGFFDFYIIPLAKKLKDCGVFGVSSDEYLNYAVSNRKEWELQGEDVVATMAAKYLPELREEDDEGEAD